MPIFALTDEQTADLRKLVDPFLSVTPWNSAMDAAEAGLHLAVAVAGLLNAEQATGFLDPTGTHVADTLGDEVIVAYGHYTDDEQAVITLLPRSRQAISPERPTSPGGPHNPPAHSNYCTFFMDEDRNRTEVQWHANIVQAVERYTEEMGMDL